jgi:ATP/ADP translocase
MNVLYSILMGLLFWNQANRIFDKRQAKRIFPLISAGGILGGTIGGFGTALLTQVIRIDNLALAYTMLVFLGAVVSGRMSGSFTSKIPSRKSDPRKSTKKIKKEM